MRAASSRSCRSWAAIFARGLYLPEQGFVANPERLTKSLAAQFQRDGGKILQRKVLDIEVGPDGPRALVTDAGNAAGRDAGDLRRRAFG